MTPISFLKVLNVLPAQLKRNAVYFVYIGATGLVNIYVTDEGANARPVGQAVSPEDILTAITSSFVFDETPSGSINGSNATFFTLSNFIPGTPLVFLNGLKQNLNLDFTTTGTNQINMNASPISTDTITVNYIKP